MAGTFIQSGSAFGASGSFNEFGVAFSKPQTGGDLNVVCIIWTGALSVATVQDSAGNTYQLAAGPTADASGTQSVYYCPDIVSTSGLNTVMVMFTGAVTFPVLMIGEWSGVAAASAVDVTAAATGTSTAPSSGSATSLNATDLLIGAVSAGGTISAPGASFTTRVSGVGGANCILEDQNVSVTGSYAATATTSASVLWIAQLVAFKQSVGSGANQPPPVSMFASGTGVSRIGLV